MELDCGNGTVVDLENSNGAYVGDCDYGQNT